MSSQAKPSEAGKRHHKNIGRTAHQIPHPKQKWAGGMANWPPVIVALEKQMAIKNVRNGTGRRNWWHVCRRSAALPQPVRLVMCERARPRLIKIENICF